MNVKVILYKHKKTGERFVRYCDKYEKHKNATIILLSRDENDGSQDIFLKSEEAQKELQKNFVKIGKYHANINF